MKEALLQNSKYTGKQILILCCFLIPVAIVGWLSLDPRFHINAPFEGFDKLEHMCAYMALSFLSRLCLSARRQRQSLYLLITFSVVLEILQAFIPTRECDPLDALANCIGVGFGALLGMMLRSRFRVFAY